MGSLVIAVWSAGLDAVRVSWLSVSETSLIFTTGGGQVGRGGSGSAVCNLAFAFPIFSGSDFLLPSDFRPPCDFLPIGLLE